MQTQVPHFLRVPQVVLWESLPRSFRRVPHFSLILGKVGFFACASPIPLSPSELKPSSATAIIRSIIIPDSIRHLCSSRLQKKILSQRISIQTQPTFVFPDKLRPPHPSHRKRRAGPFPAAEFSKISISIKLSFRAKREPCFPPADWSCRARKYKAPIGPESVGG